MFDSHLHLHQYDDVARNIAAWQAAGIEGVIAVSDDLASSYETLKLALDYPTFVYPAIGFHPERAVPSERDIVEWESLVQAERQRLVAIGEVGLPYYTTFADDTAHRELLHHCCHIAANADLAVALHAVREGVDDVFHIVSNCRIERAHFHWLKATQNQVAKLAAARYFMSFTPEWTKRERDQQLIAHVPPTCLLLETDGPYPQPYVTTDETTPLLLVDSYKACAVSPEQIRANIRACYRI